VIVVYEVRATNADGSDVRFELKRDEPLKEGDPIYQGMTIYTVVRVLHDESNRYDEIVEAKWHSGPAQFPSMRA
jgi:hypothetical protein